MGLQRFLKLRRAESQPSSAPVSPSRSRSRSLSSTHRSSLAKKLFTRRSSSAKDIPNIGSSRSSSRSLFRHSNSNPCSSGQGSTELVKDLEGVFKKFDANGDGKISWVDLGSIMGALGYKATEEELHSMIKEADCDGDGFIDLQEFIDLNTKDIDSAGSLKELRDAFEIFDLDGNGAISTDELHRVLRNLGEESSMEDCEMMIRGVDFDGNGMVDFEEFKTMMSRSL